MLNLILQFTVHGLTEDFPPLLKNEEAASPPLFVQTLLGGVFNDSLFAQTQAPLFSALPDGTV